MSVNFLSPTRYGKEICSKAQCMFFSEKGRQSFTTLRIGVRMECEGFAQAYTNASENGFAF